MERVYLFHRYFCLLRLLLMEVASIQNGSSERKMRSILRHISHVRENCEVLGTKLIENHELENGRLLIANGLIHDNSKLHGIEWLHLNEHSKIHEPEKFQSAIVQHTRTNPHHPEYVGWGCIHRMPRVYLAEMVCDWHARSSEFGSSVREWIDSCAVKKYDLGSGEAAYKQIIEFLDLLLERKFE